LDQEMLKWANVFLVDFTPAVGWDNEKEHWLSACDSIHRSLVLHEIRPVEHFLTEASFRQADVMRDHLALNPPKREHVATAMIPQRRRLATSPERVGLELLF